MTDKDTNKDHDKKVEEAVDKSVMTDQELDEVAGGFTKRGDTYTSRKKRG